MLDEFRIEEGESEKLVLIQVHHEELVGGRQVQLLGRELLVKVADVFAVFLLTPNPPNRTAKRQPSKRSANIIPVRADTDTDHIIKIVKRQPSRERDREKVKRKERWIVAREREKREIDE